MNSNKKKKAISLLIACIIAVGLFALFQKYYNVQPISLVIEVKSDRNDNYQVYYDTLGNKQWSDDKSITQNYDGSNEFKKLKFNIPIDTKNIRIDLGTTPSNIEIQEFYLEKGEKYNFTKEEINEEINGLTIDESNGFKINIETEDSYIVLENVKSILGNLTGRPVILTTIMIIASILLGSLTAKALNNLKKSIKFLKMSLSNVQMIKSLSINDFKNKYASSYLGIIWGFIQPLVTILVYWFVFQVGFRSADVGDVPFILWFIAGIIPWFFFSDAWPSTTGVFTEYSYLVKKVVFKIEILPIVKIISSLFVHLFFILFIYVIAALYGYYPDIYSLQFIYYSFAMIVLVYSLSIITSSIVLFFSDLSQIINILMNMGFWITPIGWQLTMLPSSVARIFKLNPLYYIVTGYRDAFVDKIFFWQRPYQTVYFWMFCLVTLLIGIKLFNKLRPHFSDVI